MSSFVTIRECYELITASDLEWENYQDIELSGWVRTNRCSKNIGFIELNDGTYFKNLQCVYDDTLNNFDVVSKYSVGSALTIKGCLKATPENKQPFECVVSEIVLEGECDNSYPLQKKRHSFEYLREISHLRPRTNTFMAVFRLRSALSMAIHEFFQNQGFVYVHSPIITSNDGEGGSQPFTVTTRKDGDYEKDFFGKHALLSVTGQLQAEAYALAFRDVYTFGPTFRSERSNTTRHAAEFWMIEPEIAFADLDDVIVLIEDMVKYCIQYVLENCPCEMEFFNERIDNTLLERLKLVLNSDFSRMTYTQVIDELLKSGKEFEFPVYWGCDLASEHERYICEKVVGGPVFVTDYPRDLKAFYMRENDDHKTVAACDLLVPTVGELVGGSQREERYDVLKQKMQEFHIDENALGWYLDLRKYGGCMHGGFGLGFERFLMYLSGMGNIRDVIPFPRTVKNLDF